MPGQMTQRLFGRKNQVISWHLLVIVVGCLFLWACAPQLSSRCLLSTGFECEDAKVEAIALGTLEFEVHARHGFSDEVTVKYLHGQSRQASGWVCRINDTATPITLPPFAQFVVRCRAEQVGQDLSEQQTLDLEWAYSKSDEEYFGSGQISVSLLEGWLSEKIVPGMFGLILWKNIALLVILALVFSLAFIPVAVMPMPLKNMHESLAKKNIFYSAVALGLGLISAATLVLLPAIVGLPSVNRDNGAVLTGVMIVYILPAVTLALAVWSLVVKERRVVAIISLLVAMLLWLALFVLDRHMHGLVL